MQNDKNHHEKLITQFNNTIGKTYKKFGYISLDKIIKLQYKKNINFKCLRIYNYKEISYNRIDIGLHRNSKGNFKSSKKVDLHLINIIRSNVNLYSKSIRIECI